MEYITLEEFKNFYWINSNDKDDLITQLIKDAWAFFDLWTNLLERNETWKQRMYWKNIVTLINPVKNIISARLLYKDWWLCRNLLSNQYFLSWNRLDVSETAHFIEITATIWYFDLSNIPEEIKSLNRSITKFMYDEYYKNTWWAEIRQKTIWRFTLWYFEKKIEKTWLLSILANVRARYWIEVNNWQWVNFYFI